MITLNIEHAVRDVNIWKSASDSDPIDQQGPDVHGYRDGSADTQSFPWQAQAVATYQQGRSSMEEKLRTELSNRLYDLTGQEVRPDLIYANVEKKSARVSLDRVSFRLSGGQVVMLAPCAYCGVREFESPAIESREELGYALSVWKPYCHDCVPEDPLDCA